MILVCGTCGIAVNGTRNDIDMPHTLYGDRWCTGRMRELAVDDAAERNIAALRRDIIALRLIADTAPDLRAALRAFMEQHDDEARRHDYIDDAVPDHCQCDLCDAARAAIAKATGR